MAQAADSLLLNLAHTLTCKTKTVTNLLECHLLEALPLSDGTLLHVVEAADKLLVRALQGIVGAETWSSLLGVS